MKKKQIISVMCILLMGLILSADPAFAGKPDHAKGGGKPGPSIVDVAIEVNSTGDFAGQFDTLIAAVLAANPLVLSVLSGNGQYTVFAPTDDAFEAIGITPDNVDEFDQDFLTDVLLYHVARGRRDSTDVLDSERIRMLKGGFLLQDSGVLTDNGGRTATIQVVDVEAANGIIHVIDSVVIP